MKIIIKTIFFSVTALLWCVLVFAASQGDVGSDVRDYASLLRYASKCEEIAVKAGKVPSVRAGERLRLIREGIELSAERPFKISAGKEVYLGNEKQIAIYDRKTHKVSIVDVNGRFVREGKITKYKDDGGLLAFSEIRIIVIGGVLSSNGGFKIYDFNGHLIKEVNPGFVDGYSVSHTSKYFAITASNPPNPYIFVLYDMDGKELWRHEVLPGDRAKIEFTRDDKYAILKLPEYWVADNPMKSSTKIKKNNKLYLFDIANRKVLSEEDYD